MRGLFALPIGVSLATIPVAVSAWPPPEKAHVSLEVFIEGKLIAGWNLAPDGNGEYWEPAPHGNDASSPTAAKRSVAAGKAGYRLVSALVKPSYMFVEDRVKCGDHVAGQPRGTIAWTNAKGEKSIGAFDMGCQMQGSKTLIVGLSKATQQMKAWSEQGQPQN